jgi:hypothetical protein
MDLRDYCRTLVAVDACNIPSHGIGTYISKEEEIVISMYEVGPGRHHPSRGLVKVNAINGPIFVVSHTYYAMLQSCYLSQIPCHKMTR